ncbi:MAG: FtsX-like permease family protein, partial [Chitinophagaceae bacterium]|nr:FtsX-like permease family protein [Chitinophagaceae bacterium]
ANTDFHLSVICSFATFRLYGDFYGYSTDWGSTDSNFQLFMLMPPGGNKAEISQQLFTHFSNKYYGNKGINKRFNFLQSLSDIHFDNRMEGFGDHVTSRSTLWTLSLIGVFIMIMACINFINLSTAQAVRRSKEIGIRKVLGSNRKTLFWQMMCETGVMVIAAVVIAIILSKLCLPLIKNATFIAETPNVYNLKNLVFIIGLAAIVTFLAGFYPSLIMSGFAPALALKSKFTAVNVGGISLRRGLVILQFSISQMLIVGTIIAVKQMNFIHTADLGFNKDAVLVLSSSRDSVIQSRYPSFRKGLMQISGVQNVSFSSDAPSSDNGWSQDFSYDHKPSENWPVFIKLGDENFLSTYGLQLIAGTPYSRSDTMKDFVVNETVLKKLGVTDPANAVGKDVRIGDVNGPWRRITGVVKDFKTGSFRDKTPPLVLSTGIGHYNTTSIKINSGNLAATKEAIEKTWNIYYPEYAVVSNFIDDNISKFYRQEDQLSLLYKLFAGIAIFISCLGLYGLVSFMTVQKTKEVGIRKVLGASASSIMFLFSREFILLVCIAFALAAPAAWYVMHNWLSNFAYQTTVGAGIFIVAMIISICIALATVTWKSVKAAMANPVQSLKME